jgi:membrane-associated protease RseP (regulator of RpoE activity)
MSEFIESAAVQPAWSAPPDTVDRIRRLIAADMVVESTAIPRLPADGVVVFVGRLLRPSHEVFGRWQAALRGEGYTPMLRPLPHRPADVVSLHILPGVPVVTPSRPRTNVILFLLTALSTLFVGSLYVSDAVRIDTFWDLLLALLDRMKPQHIIEGWPFALTLLGILSAHEFGHYFAARYHKVAVTLPYFIPLPIGFGTLGAFIRLKEPVPDRRKLFDIGVAGPLAGLFLAVPLLVLGLATSAVDVPPAIHGVQVEGNSILYYVAKIAVFGKALPNPITGEDVFMNQVTFAAWIGLLVTALNLLPVGQLDGGHTVYALFGPQARPVNLATVGGMAVLAVAGLEPLQAVLPFLRRIGYAGWFLWLVLILFVLGPHHPPALDDVTQLDSRRRLVGYLVIVCFILTFVPVPWRVL